MMILYNKDNGFRQKNIRFEGEIDDDYVEWLVSWFAVVVDISDDDDGQTINICCQ